MDDQNWKQIACARTIAETIRKAVRIIQQGRAARVEQVTGFSERLGPYTVYVVYATRHVRGLPKRGKLKNLGEDTAIRFVSYSNYIAEAGGLGCLIIPERPRYPELAAALSNEASRMNLPVCRSLNEWEANVRPEAETAASCPSPERGAKKEIPQT